MKLEVEGVVLIHVKRKAADKLSNFVSHMRSGFGYVPLLPTLDQLIFTEAGKKEARQ